MLDDCLVCVDCGSVTYAFWIFGSKEFVGASEGSEQCFLSSQRKEFVRAFRVRGEMLDDCLVCVDLCALLY